MWGTMPEVLTNFLSRDELLAWVASVRSCSALTPKQKQRRNALSLHEYRFPRQASKRRAGSLFGVGSGERTPPGKTSSSSSEPNHPASPSLERWRRFASALFTNYTFADDNLW
jgi:hypothetical protein